MKRTVAVILVACAALMLVVMATHSHSGSTGQGVEGRRMTRGEPQNPTLLGRAETEGLDGDASSAAPSPPDDRGGEQVPREPPVEATTTHISGRVLDHEGRPVSGVVVRGRSPGEVFAQSAIETAADGHFSVVVSGRLPVSLGFSETPLEYVRPSAFLFWGSASDVEVTLIRSRTIAARFEPPLPEGLAGEERHAGRAAVMVLWPPLGGPRSRVTTLTNIHVPFEIEVPADAPAWTRVYGAALSSRGLYFEAQEIRPEQDEVLFSGRPGSWIRGQVLGESSADGDVEVRAVAIHAPFREVLATSRLDGRGFFSLEALPPGVFDVVVFTRSDSGALHLQGRVRGVPTATATLQVRLTQNVEIAWAVEGAADRESVTISAWADNYVVDSVVAVTSDGRATGTIRVPVREGGVELIARGHDSKRCARTPWKGAEARMRLSAPLSIRGRVEGYPGGGGQIIAASKEWRANDGIGADGAFALRGLPPGTYSLSLCARQPVEGIRRIVWRRLGRAFDVDAGQSQVVVVWPTD